MSNNKNKIFIICLSFLLVLSIGYASFSENINVVGTATANSKFEIDATCVAGISDELIDNDVEDLYTLNSQHGYSNEICTVSNGVVNIDVDLEYPGATRYYTVKFTNNGTIPAQIVVSGTGNDIKNKSILNKKNSPGVIVDSASYENLDYYWRTFSTSTGVIMPSFTVPSGKVIVEDLEESFGTVLVYPGCSIYGIISAIWDKTDSDNNFAQTGEYLEYDLLYEFKFNQPTSETINLWDSVIDTL